MKRNKEFMPYETDASQTRGCALDVVLPTTIAEVKKVVASSKRVVPRGGGTGLSGGAVPQNCLDVVVDLSKINRIGEFDKDKNSIVVEAGVILDDLQDFVERYGLEFPVNPSSHAVATIGGMIATNAVGSRAVKYGRTSDWVKWVEIIDSHGEIYRKGVTEMSDYVGMEGITGIIVRACLKLSPKKSRTATLIEIGNFSEVVEIVKNLKRNSEVSMVEFIDEIVSSGVGFGNGTHLIVEYEDGSGQLKDEEYQELLLKRDLMYPFVSSSDYFIIEDPKIMIDKFPALMEWLNVNKIPTFGHISVGILHPCFRKGQEELIEEMMKFVKKIGGQISGEHGIGVLKKDFVEATDRKIIENVKRRTDPENKFNVGKII
ncbi:MAG: FAD-binding oxidoreductase [archaeon]